MEVFAKKNMPFNSHVLSFVFSFFQDGLKTADKLKQYIEKLAADLYNVCTVSFVLQPFNRDYEYSLAVCKNWSLRFSMTYFWNNILCSSAKTIILFLNKTKVAELWMLVCMTFCISGSQIKQTQDEEKKQLTALRDLIKSSLQLDQKEVGKQLGVPQGYVLGPVLFIKHQAYLLSKHNLLY